MFLGYAFFEMFHGGCCSIPASQALKAVSPQAQVLIMTHVLLPLDVRWLYDERLTLHMDTYRGSMQP